MKKFLRLLLLLIAAFCAAMFLWQYIQGEQGNKTYDAVAELAFRKDPEKKTAEKAAEPVQPAQDTRWTPAPVEDEDPNMKLLEGINLDALREVNPDVIGWIMIPDSKINYPLLQGTDNDYYLNHTWDHQPYGVGSIYMEYQCSPDFTDFNTLIYGHNMKNGSMFASLRKYSDKKYWQERPYVYIVSDQGVYRYEIFAFYRAPLDSLAYALDVRKDSTKSRFLTSSQESSKTDTGVVPEITDRILTLSTCSGSGKNYRWVVQARLKMIQETVVS